MDAVFLQTVVLPQRGYYLPSRSHSRKPWAVSQALC